MRLEGRCPGYASSMPLYEYACVGCGAVWEELQRIVDAPIEVCPACKGLEIKRLVGASSFVLKGDGWAADGYAPKKI